MFHTYEPKNNAYILLILKLINVLHGEKGTDNDAYITYSKGVECGEGEIILFRAGLCPVLSFQTTSPEPD